MSKKNALIIMLTILSAVLVFHLLIFVQYIPYDKVWAGKLNSVEEMKTFETVSILINVIMMLVLSIKYRLLSKAKENKFIDILIWCFVVLFALNTGQHVPFSCDTRRATTHTRPLLLANFLEPRVLRNLRRNCIFSFYLAQTRTPGLASSTYLNDLRINTPLASLLGHPATSQS